MGACDLWSYWIISPSYCIISRNFWECSSCGWACQWCKGSTLSFTWRRASWKRKVHYLALCGDISQECWSTWAKKSFWEEGKILPSSSPLMTRKKKYPKLCKMGASWLSRVSPLPHYRRVDRPGHPCELQLTRDDWPGPILYQEESFFHLAFQLFQIWFYLMDPGFSYPDSFLFLEYASYRLPSFSRLTFLSTFAHLHLSCSHLGIQMHVGLPGVPLRAIPWVIMFVEGSKPLCLLTLLPSIPPASLLLPPITTVLSRIP